MKYTLADLGEYDPLKNVINDILGKWDRQEPLRNRTAILYQENSDLLDKIIELEAEMKKKRTLMEVQQIRTQISSLRDKMNKNDEEIDYILNRRINES